LERQNETKGRGGEGRGWKWLINEWVSDETLQTVSLLLLLMISIDE
jgi:hypothetical protein